MPLLRAHSDTNGMHGKTIKKQYNVLSSKLDYLSNQNDIMITW